MGKPSPCVVGDSSLEPEEEVALRKKMISRAVEILGMDAPGPKTIFTLDGTE